MVQFLHLNMLIVLDLTQTLAHDSIFSRLFSDTFLGHIHILITLARFSWAPTSRSKTKSSLHGNNKPPIFSDQNLTHPMLIFSAPPKRSVFGFFTTIAFPRQISLDNESVSMYWTAHLSSARQGKLLIVRLMFYLAFPLSFLNFNISPHFPPHLPLSSSFLGFLCQRTIIMLVSW